MLPRLPLRLRLPTRPITYLTPTSPICHRCLSHRYRAHAFHTTRPSLADNPSPTHYETLDLPPTASSAEIKRQFYTLSKKHHPDRNPDDPTASTRFVAISEAYHTLSVPEKRAQYDAQLYEAQNRGSSRWGTASGSAYPQGSYSSASYAGSRPASGLNKKRGTFRGPPPSFYNSGGYGKHGAKRAEYANHNPHPHASASANAGSETANAGQDSYGAPGGFGPGQARHGFEVPHFDDRRHKETHDHIQAHIHARRKRFRNREAPDDYEKGGMLSSFLLISGVLMVSVTGAAYLRNISEKNGKSDTQKSKP